MNLASSSPLTTIGSLLAGEFENQQQALAEPTWYVRLRLWHRPLPGLFNTGMAFFIEQLSVASGNPPYRQRIIHLQEATTYPEHQTPDSPALIGQYYGLQSPSSWGGAALEPERLQALTADDLIALPTCRVLITMTTSASANPVFHARMPADTLGQFDYAGKTTYVRLGFDIQQSLSPHQVEFRMYDKGIDPSTGSATWGALMGPFRLVKQSNF